MTKFKVGDVVVIASDTKDWNRRANNGTVTKITEVFKYIEHPTYGRDRINEFYALNGIDWRYDEDELKLPTKKQLQRYEEKEVERQI